MSAEQAQTLPEATDVIDQTRHLDHEMVSVRIDELQSSVFAPLVESCDFNDLNKWQQDTLKLLRDSLEADQVVDLPTRSGKSYLIRKIAEQASRAGLRTLIVAPKRRILREHGATLAEAGVEVVPFSFEPNYTPWAEEDSFPVGLASTHKVAVANTESGDAPDKVDLLLIDEVHKALGKKTVESMRQLFPDAVRIGCTATPDYSQNRSVTHEYGDKLISHSIVEAISEGRSSSARALLYKTDAIIDYLDPSNPDFTPRELKRLARFTARNNAIVDIAEDLVGKGRQGLVTTIPGENLLHADILKKLIEARVITDETGRKRDIVARVVRGSDEDLDEVLELFEQGEIDILLYCDVLRESYTTKAASFLINGRPRTSIVDLTQDVGRVLEPKEEEAVIIDFLDDSIKHQVTVYDVLELDRATQAIALQQGNYGTGPESSQNARDTYLRGLFRAGLVDAFQEYDNRLIHDLHYQPEEPTTPYERRRQEWYRERTDKYKKESIIWERALKKAGLEPDLPDDLFMVSPKGTRLSPVDPDDLSQGYYADILGGGRSWGIRSWEGFDHNPVILPAIPTPNEEIDKRPSQPRVEYTPTDPQLLATEPGSNIQRKKIEEALRDLPEREEKILRLRFGLDGSGGSRTLQQVAAIDGVTRERLRQIEAKALAKLRDPRRSNGLREIVQDSWAEPDRADILAYRALVKAGIDPGRLRTTKNVDTSPSRIVDIEQNRKLIEKRDAYYQTLYDVFFDGHNIPEVQGAHRLIDELAKEFEGYNPNDYVTHRRIAKELGEKFDGPTLRRATLLLSDSKKSFYSMRPEERGNHIALLKARAQDMKQEMLSALTE